MLPALVLLVAACAGAALAQQTPPTPAQEQQEQNRDLKPVLPSKPTKAVTVPRSYALVVGISKYANLPPAAQLQFPNRDAEDIYTTLISPDGGQFPAENVHMLVDDKATAANIHHELEVWLPSVTKDDDRVLIYFAGHGFVSGGRGYIAPYDISLKNISGTAYPMDELGQTIGGKIKGKWKVLITDSCHSGAITPEADRKQVNDTFWTCRNPCSHSLPAATASRALKARSGAGGMASLLTTSSRAWKAKPTRTVTAL